MSSNDKKLKCNYCNRSFGSDNSLWQHSRDKHGDKAKVNAGQISAEDFADIYDDLPDGAFFAVAEEQGLSHEDFI
jgi:hypothetical protein